MFNESTKTTGGKRRFVAGGVALATVVAIVGGAVSASEDGQLSANAHRPVVSAASTVTAADTAGIVGSTATSTAVTKPELSASVPSTVTKTQIAELQELASTEAGRAKLQNAFSKFGDPGADQWAFGVNWDHIWLTASYADIASGAINGAVAYCRTRAPAWACNWAGGVLKSWARGWGWGNNHGVWGAAYWSPYVHFTGGRW